MKIKEIPQAKNQIYFWIFFSIYFFFQLLTTIVANYINPDLTSTTIDFDSLAEEFIIVVVVAPILETIIFQYIVIETLTRFKIMPIICVFISGILFGMAHWYNLIYVVVLTIVGFIFAYYYLALRHQNPVNKLVLVTLLHALSNLIAFFDKNIVDLTF
ncbi:CPBP family intramembrane glutamic endopeptidase [Pedobacter namyangjuensis]|uniref:CPBP family intramembrane glutamic endopeptidase n=1 Tax=Pedobacter namyangjuensis TaxID=600626 RepID=UPI000DE2524B|nr:CPBP family intramembrane glutamic endopeptidase [Pedobacter namyangjuensis]